MNEAQLGIICLHLILNESVSNTYRMVVNVTRIPSPCTQLNLRRLTNDLRCNWKSTKHQLHIVVGQTLHSCRQSCRSTVSSAGDIELLQMMGKWWKFIVFKPIFFFSMQFCFILQFFFWTQLCFTSKKQLQALNWDVIFFFCYSNSPRHLGIGPDQCPLAKHSRFGGPLKRYPHEHENTARPQALVFNSIKLKCGSSKKSGGHWIGIQVGAGEDQLPKWGKK